MKILFFARHSTYLRNFESVLRLLAERGHRVHIALERQESLGGREMLERLRAEYPGITAGQAPHRKDGWFKLATRLRLGLDYLRYLEPAYATAPRLESRARERTPRFVLALTRSLAAGAAGRRLLARWIWRMEQSVPVSTEVADYIRGEAPDAVLITPLVGVVASDELDCLYGARALGIPTALCVWSWDHLSSKALIRTVPDRVFVWNPTQAEEARALHAVPATRIVVTGAQCFDQWFDRGPSRSRAEFCRRVGLPDDRPFLLWVCSSLFRGSPPEAGFVVRWVRALRGSADAALRDAHVLIRPHPQRLAEWQHVPLQDLGPGVAFWGGNPVDAGSRADYFDSLHHSAAVAGLNTSAFVEGAIAGRPIYAVLPPEYHDNQEGTIHFHYLLTVAGGLLHASRTLEEHAAQLAAALRGEIPDPERSRRFVEAFVRPQGLTRPSTPLFVDAVEALPGVARVPETRVATRLSRFEVRVLRRLLRTNAGRRWLDSPRDAGGGKHAKDDARRAARLQGAGAAR
ncbi:MAG: hypothetical protein HY824_05135 [Acidobacteria bacterium]|nr:hypothetical protein [Acidobacteriota bacterium]